MEKRRFRFLKKLSEGTFGKVYLAEIITEQNFSKVVAIKLLHAKWADHDEIIKRSRDEARVLGRLQNRHIIKVEGLISIGGKCAIIMEYLNGVDLKTLINYCAKNQIRIPRKVIFEVVADVASALDAAYNKRPMQGGEPLRLIHRDIKPSNIMMTIEADVKVLDFGTAQAKFEDREAETQALAFGSAAYMSPERFLGDEDRLSGDVYALGVTLYELLYQGRYGKANVRSEVFYQEQERRLEKLDLSEMSDELAERVRSLLRQMLSWEEAERPSLAHILEETERIAQEVNDGSLKLFCRDVVEACKQTLEDPNAKPDDLENKVLFEDGSESFTDHSASDVYEADTRSSMSFPPPIAVADVATKPEPDSIYTEPTLEVDLPTDPEVGASSNVGQQNVVQTHPSQSVQSSGGNSMMKIALGGFALLALGGGVGWFILQNQGTNVPEVEPTVVEEPALPTGKPGFEKDLGADTGTTVTLRLNHSKPVLVSIKMTGVEYDWNGDGEIVLTGVEKGLIRATVQQADDKDMRTRIPIQEGKQCVYELNLSEGATDWSESCSG